MARPSARKNFVVMRWQDPETHDQFVLRSDGQILRRYRQTGYWTLTGRRVEDITAFVRSIPTAPGTAEFRHHRMKRDPDAYLTQTG